MTIKRQLSLGRPTNETLKARGMLRVSDKCKICKSPYRDEITKLLLEGISGEEVRRRYNVLDYFKAAPLNATNIMGHRRHCNPQTVAETDHTTIVTKQAQSPEQYSSEVTALFQHQYDDSVNKLKAVDELYKQRLANMGEMQFQLKQLMDKPLNIDGTRNIEDTVRINTYTAALDSMYDSLIQAMLKHVKIEQGPAQKNINLVIISNVKTGIEQFIESFIDVIVSEITDTTTRERIKDKFVEKLDSIVAPLLDANKIEASFEILDQKKLTEK